MADGVLVVDKPSGMTSHDVVDAVREAAGQRRVGHTGTLDPDATGVLVLCLGRATRLTRFLQAGVKTYRAEAVLGVATTTQDAAGEVVAENSAAEVTREELERALEGFTGGIQQVPPMVSAVRVGGERLHERARRGEEIEREARQVTVYELELTSFTAGERARAELEVTCSSGTYVRTLVHDLGRALSCGAHVVGLRRTRNGAFTEADAHPLDRVREDLGGVLLSMREGVRGLPEVTLNDPGAARDVVHGRSLPGTGRDGPWTVVFGGRLLAVYADREGVGRPEAVLAQPEDLPTPDRGHL